MLLSCVNALVTRNKFTRNKDSYAKLLVKYQFVCDVLDDSSVEVRSITDISWRKSAQKTRRNCDIQRLNTSF